MENSVGQVVPDDKNPRPDSRLRGNDLAVGREPAERVGWIPASAEMTVQVGESEVPTGHRGSRMKTTPVRNKKAELIVMTSPACRETKIFVLK